jgi:hypothetical protein
MVRSHAWGRGIIQLVYSKDSDLLFVNSRATLNPINAGPELTMWWLGSKRRQLDSKPSEATSLDSCSGTTSESIISRAVKYCISGWLRQEQNTSEHKYKHLAI